VSGALVLGIDLGTSSCKACLADGQGRVAARGRAGYPTHAPRPGWTEQDARDWLPAAARAVREALVAAGGAPVAAIGLSSAAHIGVLLDERNEPVRPAILWSDQRSADEVGSLEASIGETIFGQTRNRASTTWTLPHLLWVRRHDVASWARTRRVALSKDYLLWLLTGRWATDAAAAVSSMLFDAARMRWSESLCTAGGVEAGALPALAGASEVVGHLTASAADVLGLRPGLPVVAGTLDSAAELCAAGVTRPGEALIRLATAGGIEVVSAEPRPHPLLISYPHPVQPRWYNQAGTSSCGSAIDWAARLFGGGRGAIDYGELNRLAGEAPAGCEGLVFNPYLAGERCPHWDPRLRGSFAGLGLSHGPAHAVRAVLEGVSFSIRDALSALPAPVSEDTPFKVVGGGTASGLWLAILTAVLGRPLVPVPQADSSHGAALLALPAVSGVAAEALCRFAAAGGEPTVVDPDWRAVYEGSFVAYRMIHRQLREVYHRHDQPPAGEERRP
jgi:xylulokinase